jgi:hypothetical protein
VDVVVVVVEDVVVVGFVVVVPVEVVDMDRGATAVDEGWVPVTSP